MGRLAAAAICAVLAACAQAARVPQSSAYPHFPARRIVTLMPSFAEDLCAIGAQRQLVGVSDYSADVSCARNLPVVNNFSAVNTEKIVQLHADVAFAIPAQRMIAAGLVHAQIPVTYLADDTYGDIFTDIGVLGAISGHSKEAARLEKSLRAQTAALQRRAHFNHKPSVLFVEQSIPLWTIGPRSYIATLIELAGGRIATGSLRQAYGQFSDEALLRNDPDVIVATSDAHIEAVLQREPWRSLRAVRAHHVFVVPDSNALERPGPRYIKGLQWLIARFSSL